MKIHSLFILFMLLCQGILAEDSIRQASIQGLDISVDFIGNSSSHEREYQILENIVDEKYNVYQFVNSNYKDFSYTKKYIRANIDLIFYGKDLHLFKRNIKTEFKFGLSYSYSNKSLVKGSRWNYEFFSPAGDFYTREVQLKYYSHQEQLQFSYLLNSNAFAKHFKIYAGLGVGAMLSTWSSGGEATNSRYQVNGFTYPIEKYTVPAFALQVPFGIKYNLSCDLNIFSEGKIGSIYTPKLNPAPWQITYALCLGMRFKFGQSETTIKRINSFW